MTTSGGPSTAPAGQGPPRPAFTSQPAHSEAVKERKDLASWWKNFKRSDKKPQEQAAPHGIFGVPLQHSIRYANVAISLFNDEGQSYIYGYVPIVVAKCGVFLKEKATDVEGIFRLAGSEKRIKELKAAFDSPDRYGKGLDWTGYTVHDAANILRRYFNQLPEPIIPLEFYQRFRDPLRNHQAQAVGSLEAQSPSEGEFDQEAAIRAYQALITELPPLNRQLLLYILDLLAVFASKSDLNKMTTPNLAAIFQPGILNHPQHDMAPQEYRLSQDVLIFLIENQDSFLIGMQGTEADADTVRDVQSGGSPSKPPSTPTTPGRSKTIIGRSSSNSSVAAESVRKWGSIRRNVSVSSKHSKRSEHAPPPGSPVPGTPTSSGVHRSNTVPSRRGGSTGQSPRFSKEKHSDPSTPTAPASTTGASASSGVKVERPSTSERRGSLQSTPVAAAAPAFPTMTSASQVQPPEVTSASSSEATTPLAAVGRDRSREYHTPRKDTIPLLAPGTLGDRSGDRNSTNTPSSATGRKFLDILKQSPTSDGEGRKPNKLQKKRTPGSALSSAHSSAHDLHEESKEESRRSPISPSFAPATVAEIQTTGLPEHSNYATAQTTPVQATPQRNPTDATLKPTLSPSNSFHSHTDQSDADLVGDDMPAGLDQPEKKKRSRWRFSRAQNKLDQASTPGNSNPLGTMSAREQATSRSTIGSGGSAPRKSFQESTPIGSVATEAIAESRTPSGSQQQSQASATSDTVFSDSERERKGPMSWLRNKIQERKEKEVEKRSGTPERGHERDRSKQDLQLAGEGLPVRGKSFEQSRAVSDNVSSASGIRAVHAPIRAISEAQATAANAPVNGTSNQKVAASAGLNDSKSK
ncbi:hypothetical protein AC578_5422 [Pseudocercospora eumusae]|uniref:Rho-GAP domain-containing protein n=1 Tax=Pseudocercospora eumusae TaxID=321146 RepID=A0A139HJP2_9PEZI|nr:hypothetical protein AC578_5422 [Pseudocercospora eumusae]